MSKTLAKFYDMTHSKLVSLFTLSFVLLCQLIFAQKAEKAWREAKLHAKTITVLRIKKIPFSDWDNEIAAFEKLSDLTLEGLNLDSIPESICELQNLRYLRLGNNNIQELPACVCELQNIEIISLWDNDITFLPKCLSTLKLLKEIDLHGIKYSVDEQLLLKDNFPRVNFSFSDPCDCKFERQLIE